MSKRLTDAECAAEYWRAEADSLYAIANMGFPADDEAETCIHREKVCKRFATHPHAHEGS